MGNGNFTLPFKKPTLFMQGERGQAQPREEDEIVVFFLLLLLSGFLFFVCLLLCFFVSLNRCQPGHSPASIPLYEAKPRASRDMNTLGTRPVPSHSLGGREQPRWLNVLFNARGT